MIILIYYKEMSSIFTSVLHSSIGHIDYIIQREYKVKPVFIRLPTNSHSSHDAWIICCKTDYIHSSLNEGTTS